MTNAHDRAALQQIARQAVLAAGLQPDFSPAAITQLGTIQSAATDGAARDLRSMLWCSIDNDDSRDLDQLSVAEALPDGAVKVLVAIADVDALVGQGTALDLQARENTTSIYTAAQIFPMLPERLSTDLTSLGFDVDRKAMVIEMTVAPDGSLRSSDVYPAMVRNKARLAYDSVAAWLDGTGPLPGPLTAVAGLDENIRLQHGVAEKLRALRHTNGALDFESVEVRPVFDGDTVTDLAAQKTNSAKELIADLMIASNGVTARKPWARIRTSALIRMS